MHRARVPAIRCARSPTIVPDGTYRSTMSGFRKAALLAAIIALPAVPVNAQEQVTEADCARAESMLRNTTSSLVFSASVSPDWLPD